MDIKLIRIERNELELEIKRLINSFQKDTDSCVSVVTLLKKKGIVTDVSIWVKV